MKKIILLLTSLMVTTWSVVAFETDGIEYETIRNYPPYELRVAPRLNGGSYSGDIVIPATTTSPHTGETIYPVVEIKSSAFSRSKELTSVVISDGIKTIGGSAFYDCEALTSVTIPSSVTSMGSSTFYNCKSLQTFNYPEQLTSIGADMFYGSGLVSFIVPANITTIGIRPFADCKSLTAIYVDSENKNFVSEDGVLFSYDKKTLVQYPVGKTDAEYTVPAGVTTIAYGAFHGCTHLTSVIMQEGLVTIGIGAFYECNNLTSVTIPTGVTSIGQSAFYNCNKIESITLPATVTSLSNGVFYQCSSLSSITMPGVKTIQNNAFGFCESLTSFTVSEIVTSIEENAFYGCTKLETLYFNAKNCSAANFKPCTSLTNLIIGDSVTTIPANTFSDLKMETLILPESIKNIGNNAFSKLSIKTLILPENIQSIGDNAFSECNALIEITIPEGITSIGIGAFSNCKGLKRVNFNAIACDAKNTNTFLGCDALETVKFGSKVTRIPDGAFNACVSLTDIQLPLSLKTLGYRSFYGCSGLTSVVIPENVETTGSSPFENCINLKTLYYNSVNGKSMNFSNLPITELIIGDSVKAIPSWCFPNNKELKTLVIPPAVRSIGGSAFSNCTGLTSIILPDSLEYLGNAFEGCTGLTSITIPEEVTYIEYAAFKNCTNLQVINYNAKRAYMPYNTWYGISCEGCTSLTTVNFGDSVRIIPDGAFNGCEFIKEITLPPFLEKIGTVAFQGCSSITSITIPEKVTEVGADAFGYCNVLKTLNYNADSCITTNLVFTNSPIETINIGDNVISLPAKAFYGCPISEITIPENVRYIGEGVLFRCANLKTINYNAINCSTPGSGFGGRFISDHSNLYYDGNKTLTTVNIGNKVETIPNYLFAECRGITSIVIPENVKYIGNMVFYHCTGLETVYYNAINCKTVGNTTASTIYSSLINPDTNDYSTPFYECINFKELIVGEGVEHIPPFAFCHIRQKDIDNYLRDKAKITFKKVVLPSSLKTIGEYAFFNKLDSAVTLPPSVTYVGDSAFFRCNVHIGIMPELSYVGDHAFYYAKIKGDVILSAPYVTIGDYAFAECENITSFVVRDSTAGAIGNYAFYNTYSASSLSYVYIGNKVTEIGNYAFYNNRAFDATPRIISLGKSVTNIGKEAFALSSPILTNIVCYGDIPPICDATTFGRSAYERTLSYSTTKLHVPESAVTEYAADNVWKNFITVIPFDNTQENGVTITPDEESAYISWNRGGGWWSSNYYYILTVYSDASHSEVVATFRFNSNGELVEKNYLKAGSADFSYTIDDLESGTTYYYTLKAYNENDEITDIQNGNFTTSPSSGMTTGLPETAISPTAVFVTATNRNILVENTQGNRIFVTDISGRMIAQKTASQSVEQFNVSHAGIYIVLVGEKAYKVLVR